MNEAPQISVTKHDDSKIAVACPYLPEFVDAAHAYNGKWSGKVWLFSARDEDRVRRSLVEHFGTDGAADVPLATVRCHLTPAVSRMKEVFAYGRRLCVRMGRDQHVRLGDGCAIVDGAFPSSGGSVKYPTLGNETTVVIEVRDVPRPFAMRQILVRAKDDKTTLEEQVLSAEREIERNEKNGRGTDWYNDSAHVDERTRRHAELTERLNVLRDRLAHFTPMDYVIDEHQEPIQERQQMVDNSREAQLEHALRLLRDSVALHVDVARGGPDLQTAIERASNLLG